jgi:8-oxo-dGTP pyrophosphatase MutT (NUDIX family)
MMSLATASLLDRLAAALERDIPHDLLAGDVDEAATGPLREAAVLVAITDRPEPGAILTHRHHGLRDHGGQIAFPGGRVDEGEEPRAAALREAWEELALDPARVRILGIADHYRTITGFGVTPVIASIPPDLPLVPNPSEVADWFEAPLGFVLDPANHQRRETLYKGRLRSYFEIVWQGRRIWGATAAMLVNLSRRAR